MKYLFLLLLSLSLITCKKSKTEKTFTIHGILLESTSKPYPITNYALNLYQKSNAGILGGVSGLDKTVNTDNSGNFIFKYQSAQNFGFSQGSVNNNTISISGIDTLKFVNLYPEWASITPNIDVHLQKIYIYKNIENLVRKVQFNNSLLAGETVQLITSNSPSFNSKTLLGPILAGSVITVDTIKNCRLTLYNLENKEYKLYAVLYKPPLQKELNIILNQNDEILREVLITY